MRTGFRLLAGFLFTAMAYAQSPFIHQDFEGNSSGWIVFGPDSAKLEITHEPASVKVGKGALEFRYEASSLTPAAALLPTAQALEGMQSIRFWAMASSPTAFGLALNEKNGGRYLAIFWLESNTWQRVELTPEDFILSTNENDPKDPDGKLDLDRIQAIGLIDLSQIVNPMMAEHAALAVVAHTGAQRLCIDDFEVSSDRPPWFHPRGSFEMETFAPPQLNWLTLGGADLKLDTSKKIISANALESDYQQLQEHFTILLRALPPMDLKGATHLAFDIASDKEVNLIFSLTERAPGKTDGPHYNADVELHGGNKAAHREVALAAFELDTNGPADPNGKLDLDQLKTLGILDVTSAYTGETGVNTIRIGNIKAVKVTTPSQ